MNNNTFVHKYIRPLITKNDTCVDMTAGNGNDTLFLSSLSGKVIAFDIQEEAIRKAKEKTEGCSNITFICADHADVDLYVKEKVRLFIFNLGYLPGGDRRIITKAANTLQAFQKAYELTTDKGYIVITFYPGHQGGLDEYYLLSRYIHEQQITIIETYHQEKALSPITYIIRKSV